MQIPRLSATARTALTSGTEREDGRVYAARRTIATLMSNGLVEQPHYEYSRGRQSWAVITDAGREAVTRTVRSK